MDAKEFGKFVAQLRKEKNMTQAELAKQVQVTDKAISRWERGLGFPDINSLEVLAEALDVSVIELMRCRRIESHVVDCDDASQAVLESCNLQEQQKTEERKTILYMACALLALIFMLLLGEMMGLGKFLLIGFPCGCLAVSAGLVICGLVRKARGLLYSQTLVAALITFVIPLVEFAVVLILFAAGVDVF